MTGGLRPPWAATSSMPKSRASVGSDALSRSPDVILGFAEYALLSHIYLPVFLSLFAL